MPEEYIKRTDAVKIAEKYGLANGSVLGRHTGLADCIASEISELPASDVAEVVHARWERVRSNWYCTGCNKGYRITKGAPMASSFSYCPNCNAKMDGAAE